MFNLNCSNLFVVVSVLVFYFQRPNINSNLVRDCQSDDYTQFEDVIQFKMLVYVLERS